LGDFNIEEAGDEFFNALVPCPHKGYHFLS